MKKYSDAWYTLDSDGWYNIVVVENGRIRVKPYMFKSEDSARRHVEVLLQI